VEGGSGGYGGSLAPKQSHDPGNRTEPLMSGLESPIFRRRGEIPAALSCVIAFTHWGVFVLPPSEVHGNKIEIECNR